VEPQDGAVFVLLSSLQVAEIGNITV
jgi:hypothetical protein